MKYFDKYVAQGILLISGLFIVLVYESFQRLPAAILVLCALQGLLSIRATRIMNNRQRIKYREGWKGVFTRKFTENIFTKLASLADRKKENIALMVVEINDFQGYIERFGHRKAEYILKNTGELLHIISRKGDVVAILEEGKFLVVLPNADQLSSQRYLERVHKRIHELPVKVSLKYAIAVFPVDSREFEELQRKADRLLKEGRRINFIA